MLAVAAISAEVRAICWTKAAQFLCCFVNSPHNGQLCARWLILCKMITEFWHARCLYIVCCIDDIDTFVLSGRTTRWTASFISSRLSASTPTSHVHLTMASLVCQSLCYVVLTFQAANYGLLLDSVIVQWWANQFLPAANSVWPTNISDGC